MGKKNGLWELGPTLSPVGTADRSRNRSLVWTLGSWEVMNKWDRKMESHQRRLNDGMLTGMEKHSTISTGKKQPTKTGGLSGPALLCRACSSRAARPVLCEDVRTASSWWLAADGGPPSPATPTPVPAEIQARRTARRGCLSGRAHEACCLRGWGRGRSLEGDS